MSDQDGCDLAVDAYKALAEGAREWFHADNNWLAMRGQNEGPGNLHLYDPKNRRWCPICRGLALIAEAKRIAEAQR